MCDRSWTFIDEIERKTLSFLNENDFCYYYLVRISGGYSASEANSRIDNFKKKPERYRENQAVWDHKQREIICFANDVQALLTQPVFRSILNQCSAPAIIPMPTSNPRSHEFFDTRLEQLCTCVADSVNGLTYLNLFDLRTHLVPAHEGGSRNVNFLESQLILEASSIQPDLLILVDDVLTTGAHYAACRNCIRKTYPTVPIIGLFLARHKGESRGIHYGFTPY